MLAENLAADAVVALPFASASAAAWRMNGQLYVTVIAKASFASTPGETMPRIAPAPILDAEVHHDDNPARSVRFGSDLALHLHRADILFTGHGYAPTPEPAFLVAARLAVYSGDRAIVDKTVLLKDPRGFQKMPLVYERAFGGAGVAENPFGLGGSMVGGEPTIIDILAPKRPAGFGPISRAWPARKRLLGAVPRRVLDGPIAELPPSFDWSYFQAAPPDQQTDHLRGDEAIVLGGLHPTLPVLHLRLPGARGVARIHGLASFGVPEGQPLGLRTDTLHIDGDEARCTIVCRGSFGVPDERALAALRIAAGVEIAGESIRWPDPAPQRRLRLPSLVSTEADSEVTLRIEKAARTAALSPNETVALRTGGARPSPGEALPFRAPAPTPEAPRAAIAIPGAPWSAERALPAPEPGSAAMTLELGSTRAAVVLPRAEPENRAPPSPSAPPDEAPASRFFHDLRRDRRAEEIAAAAAPLAADEEVGLERYAAIAAELMELRSPRVEVLAAHGLSNARWLAAEQRWQKALDEELQTGGRALREAFDAAYVAAWETLRGELHVAEYARLTVAAERGKLTPSLDVLGIRRTVWVRMKRIWTRRIAADPRLAADVAQEIAVLRGA